MNGNINELKKLIDYYENNKNTIHSNWNETETRIELINPLFECLGWDVRNNQNLADPFKEVKHEASLKIGEHMKAPDYSFNYGKRLFFLEAKKPSIDIKSDINPSYQLRRYGWTAKLPISILTNFEDLAIYDCRIKPSHNDSAGIARIKYFTYAEYIDKWDDIYNFISKEAILHGSLNDFENKQLKGTDSIDDDFLNSIENWRKLLALNIASRNPELSEKDLNFAVQMIIDRIIFLRICEDRGIENYELLKDSTKDNCYKNLLSIFQKADDKYNSGLFHFSKEKERDELPDTITPKLQIDDKVLKDIIKDLYYPDCPYALSVISSDVLGNVYERFLGNVIRLTDGHHAKVEEKPEVRKAGGVYYTPRYIVEYIVKNTVGEIIKDKTPNQVSNIKILDPACGSGSFLIEAYQYLLDWHLTYYLNNDPEKWKKGKEPKIFESKTGLHLTLSVRKRILLNNIFGVDIDKNAVEVTKLSLLLKVLEYEGLEVQQKSLFNERVLPDLYNNIKCGNSLIGSDFYKEKDLSLFGNDEIEKINIFDWNKKFSEIFKNGGFDCVIGNPPYGAELDNNQISYIQKLLRTSIKNNNTYVMFMEKSIVILKNNGILGFITPTTFLTGDNFIELRKFLLKSNVKIIVKLPYNVFSSAYIDTCISIINKDNFQDNIEISNIPPKEKVKSVKDIENFIKESTKSNWLLDNLFCFIIDNNTVVIKNKILSNKTIKLNEICKIDRGTLPPKETTNNRIDNNEVFYWFEGQVFRYVLEEKFEKKIKCSSLNEFKTNEIFIGERILLRQLISRQFRLNAMKTNIDFAFKKNIYCIYNNSSDLQYNYLLSILNSKLFSYYIYNSIIGMQRNDFPSLSLNDARNFPIRNIDFLIEEEKTCHDRLVSLVDQMLETQKEFHNAKTDNDAKLFKQKIDIIDNQIDSLVYELYGLTEDDIKVIEAAL